MRGADKLAMPVDGTPLLRCAALIALAASPFVAVCLRPDDQARRALLEGLEVTILTVADAAEGMAASLREGARWADDLPVAALMIALPDMPEISSADMLALIAAQAETPDQPLRASTQLGTPGHPVILPRKLFAMVGALRGDSGARAILGAYPPRLHALADARAVTDLDTPEAWAAWQKQRSYMP